MAAKALPPKSILDQLLDYDPETGELFWKERDVSLFASKGRPKEEAARIWNTRFAGKKVSGQSQYGYCILAINGVTYMAHRIIWKMVTGCEPDGEIDHISGNRFDNRWCNLRDVTAKENRRNTCIRSDNKSGTVGVSRYARTGKWWAYIIVDGSTVHLGLYDDKALAIMARKKAERDRGFHPNHGRKRTAS